MFDHMRGAFESPSFIDYQLKMLFHLNSSIKNYPNTTCIDRDFPRVISRLASIDRGVYTLSHTFKDCKKSSINQMENVLYTQVRHGVNKVCTVIGSFPNRNDSITSYTESNIRQIL